MKDAACNCDASPMASPTAQSSTPPLSICMAAKVAGGTRPLTPREKIAPIAQKISQTMMASEVHGTPWPGAGAERHQHGDAEEAQRDPAQDLYASVPIPARSARASRIIQTGSVAESSAARPEGTVFSAHASSPWQPRKQKAPENIAGRQRRALRQRLAAGQQPREQKRLPPPGAASPS